MATQSSVSNYSIEGRLQRAVLLDIKDRLRRAVFVKSKDMLQSAVWVIKDSYKEQCQ